MPPRAHLLVAAAVLSGLGACSGSSADRPATPGTGFRNAYQAATTRYVDAARETSRRAGAAKGDQATTLQVYAELASQVDAVRRQYAAMPTPAQVAPEVTVVVRLLAEQVTLLRRIGPEVKARDAAAVQGAITALSRSTTDLAQARIKLDAALAACGAECF